MKTKLLFTQCLLLVFCFNYGWSQTNLTQNPTMDDHGTRVSPPSMGSTTDNADAWDVTPNNSIKDEDGNDISSPYQAIWDNDDLDDWLNTNCGDSDEQPGSSSDGNWDYSAGPTMVVKTRGVKISEACRRLYQKIAVTPGISYTLFLESRSEAMNVPSDVFILNTEIADETGINANGAADTNVDAYLNITNDFNSSKSNATTDNFTKNSLEFTPSGSFIVIYVRAPLAVDSSHEVFYDNIELYETSSLSTDDFLASNFKIYPNPVKDVITIASSNITVSSVEMYSLVGKKVISKNNLVNNTLDISNLNSGIYLLKVNADEGSLIRKIVIE